MTRFNEYRKYIELYLDSKEYENGKSTRATVRSYIKKFLDFAVAQERYSEFTNELILDYIKSYEGTDNLTTRKNRVREFVAYAIQHSEKENRRMIENENEVKSAILETEPQESVTVSDMAASENDNTEPDTPEAEVPDTPEPETPKIEPAVYELLKKRKRKSKTEDKKQSKVENDNRTQISSYLSNEVYAGIKALSLTTGQPISDIVAQVVKAFYEDNAEVINESIRTMQQLESVKSRIKYHR